MIETLQQELANWHWWQALMLMVVGVLAGFLNVMAGGGSLLTVPIMVFMGMPGPVANGTNRIAILVQNAAAVLAFFRKGFADFRLSLTLSLCAIPGAVAGALAGVRLEGVWFNRVLAVIMLLVMLITVLDKKRAAVPGELSRARWWWGHGLMVLIGLYGGFIQVGVGFLIMPVLQRVMGLDLVRVNMHKVFVVGSYTLAALIVFASQVQILWLMGLMLAIGHAVGGWLGAHVSVAGGERWISRVLNAVLLVFVVKLLFFP